MNHSSVYINNFPDKFQSLGVKDNYGITRTLLVGTSPQTNEVEMKKKICSDIITSIFTHDTLYIKVSEIYNVIEIFDIEDTLVLFRMGILKIINDNGLFAPIMEVENKFIAGGLFSRIEFLDTLRQDLHKKYSVNLIKELFLQIELCTIDIDNKKVEKLIIEEISYDIKNINTREKLGISSHSIDEIKKADIIKILRMMAMNESLIYGEMINTSNIILDGSIDVFLPTKLNPINSLEITSPPHNIFKNILEIKEIPDLGFLYSEKIISLKELLKIRNSINGNLFRLWYKSTGYNEKEFLKALMDTTSNKTALGSVIKLIRWFTPNLIGVTNPLLGAASSAVDSYIIDRIVNGWNPSMFMDNKLKLQIDKKIVQYEKTQNYERIKELYPFIQRNDECPCGSKKKFKNCCGKIVI